MDSPRAQSHAPLDDLSFEAGYLFKYPTTQEQTVAKRYREYLAHLLFVAGRVHENPEYMQQVQALCDKHRVTTAVDHGKKFDFLFDGEKNEKRSRRFSPKSTRGRAPRSGPRYSASRDNSAGCGALPQTRATTMAPRSAPHPSRRFCCPCGTAPRRSSNHSPLYCTR